jgi:hypothetical protein
LHPSTWRAMRLAVRRLEKATSTREPNDGKAQVRSSFVAARPAMMQELTAARDSSRPHATVAAQVLCRTRTSLMDAGLHLAPTTYVLFGARRYLAGEVVEGNVVVPLPVRMDDPADAAQITADMAAYVDAALPLIALLRGMWRSRRIDATRPATHLRRTAPTVLVHSHIPQGQHYNGIRWKSAAEPFIGITATPGGLGSITVTSVVIAGRLHVSMTYYDTVDVDESAIRSALARFAGVHESQVLSVSIGSDGSAQRSQR